jgi:hypothetical protein
MKSIRLMLAALASLAISATSAQAIPYLDLNLIGVRLDAKTPSYSGEFNILDGGDIPGTPNYNPTTHEVTSATVWFGFADDSLPWQDDSNETVKIDLGSVSGYLGPIEINLATIVSGAVGSLLMDLQDGKLTYKINETSGDFYVGYAKLVADVSPKTPGSRVPDGGATAALLGFGLLGLSAVRRKMRS